MTIGLAAQDHFFEGCDLVEKFASARSAGFDGIELLGAGDGRFAARADELRAVDLPSVRVVADFFHMSIEEADLDASIRAAARMLAHFQVSDSNRLEPGAGRLDWRTRLETLREIGHDGWLAMESRLSGPAAGVLPSMSKPLRG